MDESILSISLPLLRFGTSPRNIHKGDENSYFSVGKTVCTTDYFSGHFSANDLLKEGTDPCKGHSDISSESRFSDKSQKKIIIETCQNIQFLGMEINSIEMTLTFPQEKKEKSAKNTVILP